MRSTVLMATLTIAALIATACGGQAAPPAPTNPPAQPNQPSAGGKNDLAGTSWAMTTLNGQPALKATAVTLNFIADKAAGSDGCNNYSTTYVADGSTIKLKEPIATTMMACADPIMKQATAYLQALGQAASYKATATQLTLADASGKELAVFAAQSNDLADTSWNVISYNNGKQAVVSVMGNTTLTAHFGADGNLSGSSGCNTYNATYETSGQNIKIGPPATTRMACEQAVMDQETQYLAALQTAATYKIDGTKLEMRTADGALAATFQKAAGQ